MNKNTIPMNLQLFAEPAEPAAEPIAPAEPAGAEPAPSPTPSPAPDSLVREDFLQAPMLRQSKKELVEEPKPPVIPEAVPPEGTPKLETEPKEPEAKPEDKLPETTVKLPDGKEATLEQIAEWEKGYMMQADYTKKTQQLAEEKRQFQTELDGLKSTTEQAQPALELWQAFERDPIKTLEELQAHFASQGIFEAKDPNVLAAEDQLRAINQQIQTQQQQATQQTEQQAYNWLTSQLDTLSQQHADFDRDTVTQYMMDNNVLDPDKAYKLMTHDSTVESSQKQMADLQAQIDAIKADTDAKVKAAKEESVKEYIKTKMVANNAPLPVGGSGGGTPPVQINRPIAWQDARKAALSRMAGT